VRYDGQTKANALLIDFFSAAADIIPVCPEVGASLGTPRPPVQLINSAAGIRALGTNDSSLDVTRPLQQFSQHFSDSVLPKLHGIILKSRSPSCGLGTTPVQYSPNLSLPGNGIFADAMLKTASCVITDELNLHSIEACSRFLFLSYVAMDIGLTADAQQALLLQHYLEQHQLNLAHTDWRHFF
jgi:uncharacterized protein YbbK (DUF523 family)